MLILFSCSSEVKKSQWRILESNGSEKLRLRGPSSDSKIIDIEGSFEHSNYYLSLGQKLIDNVTILMPGNYNDENLLDLSINNYYLIKVGAEFEIEENQLYIKKKGIRINLGRLEYEPDREKTIPASNGKCKSGYLNTPKCYGKYRLIVNRDVVASVRTHFLTHSKTRSAGSIPSEREIKWVLPSKHDVCTDIEADYNNLDFEFVNNKTNEALAFTMKNILTNIELKNCLEK